MWLKSLLSTRYSSVPQVLKSIPWREVDIEVLSVELTMPGLVFPGSRAEVPPAPSPRPRQVHRYLGHQDYVYIGTLGGHTSHKQPFSLTSNTFV
jgi:hypothetical protein